MNEKRKRIPVFEAADLPKIYKGIFESYHNDSDLLAELLQNAIDSIRIAEPDAPLVEIKFDGTNKTLSVRDNGIGMCAEDLEDFAVGRTKKDAPQFSSLGGEKGLGAAYIFGGSDRFEIETCKNGSFTLAECIGAYDAIMSSDEPEFFILEEQNQERVPNYTEIQIAGRLFYLDFSDRDEIEHMIRTYTAAGYTRPLYGGDPLEVKIKLTWIDESGEERSKFVPNVFHHPVVDAEEEVCQYCDADLVEEGFGKFLMYVDKENQAIGIFGESRLFEKNNLPRGILLSVKGYPTAVEISPPSTGYAGYWTRNLLILVNYDEAVLDAGRKSIRRQDRTQVRNVAKDIFNKLVKYHKRFIRQTEAEAEKAILDNLKEEARALPDLAISDIAYKKVPNYEQGVVSIFHELLGARLLEGYYPLCASSDTRYDEIVYYEVPLDKLGDNFKKQYKQARRNIREKGAKYKQVVTVEYKLNAVDIIRDTKKDLRLIDLLIAYDCDTTKLRSQWKWVPLDDSDIVYQGARYQMRNPMNDSCYVLLLRDFCEPTEATGKQPRSRSG